LIEEWSAAVSANEEEKKRAEAATAEELKNESNLLCEERHLNEQVIRFKKELTNAESSLISNIGIT
jgi:hypothetical protein